jgi:hypothetical protein
MLDTSVPVEATSPFAASAPTRSAEDTAIAEAEAAWAAFADMPLSFKDLEDVG